MKHYIFSQGIFITILALIMALEELLGRQNKIVSIVLWTLGIICFVVMYFIRAVLKGAYSLNDKQVFIPFIISLCILGVLNVIFSIIISKYF